MTTSTTYTFPSQLRDSDKKYPWMMFKVVDNTDSVALYLPPAIQFNDGAAYNTINLGKIGSSVLNEAPNAGSLVMDAGEAIIDSYERLLNNANGSLTAAAGAWLAAKFVPGASLGSANDVFKFSQKVVVNPYTNVTFENTAVRQYGFTFKLVPSSRDESKTIKDMLSMFRHHMYPKEQGKFIASYPSKFIIKFFTNGEDETDYIPAIYECYLTSMATNYNQTSSTFFEDGAPGEVEVSLSFQETRSLTRDDIDKLEKYKIRNYRQREKTGEK